MVKKEIQIPFQIAKVPFTLFIFGASGSLAKLKLFPALYELVKEKRLTKEFKIVGYARTPMSNEEFRNFFADSIREQDSNVDEVVLKDLLKNVFYFAGSYDQMEDYARFKKELSKIEKDSKRVRAAYFSVPPSVFPDIFHNLSKTKFDTPKAKLRLIIEKPFGSDLSTAKKLKKLLDTNFKKEQIFLLDHYLGKEAVSNLLSLRYANSILTNLLSSEYVANIQISALESRDIEGRANYFDHVGTLKDMIQSHLLQVLAYFTMYAPKEKNADSIHHEKARVLKGVTVHNLENAVVRGQYQGYQQEKGVQKGSQTETYAALKISLKHGLWENVPIYIRSGKSLKQKWTGVVVEFKPRRAQRATPGIPPNRIVIQIQPYEKIEFHLLTKLGGKTFDFHELTTGRPIYCSGDCLVEHGRLFLDVLDNRQDLFLNFEEIFEAWRVVDPIQKTCDRMKEDHCKLAVYPKGSIGPKAADDLLKRDGYKWFNPEA